MSVVYGNFGVAFVRMKTTHLLTLLGPFVMLYSTSFSPIWISPFSLFRRNTDVSVLSTRARSRERERKRQEDRKRDRQTDRDTRDKGRERHRDRRVGWRWGLIQLYVLVLLQCITSYIVILISWNELLAYWYVLNLTNSTNKAPGKRARNWPAAWQ